MSNAYAVIIAGGSGSHLWPLSRQNRPKPVLPLADKPRSMFQMSVEHLCPWFSPDRILVAAIGIDTNDVLLVCPQDRAQDVKKIVEALTKNEQNEYL